ncbi:EAL domain-containing protein [uncultured Thiodictyon sp.]|uniref:putative bifunctional diguanylate cyclase/phosphodiesterase n=1 Tax=uncultured Thiodictyon sp. TaxID=1846217 RepID=UPI0025EF10AB|nr:EAL domain-containing protein [uncultured Thiodictyon sp.]
MITQPTALTGMTARPWVVAGIVFLIAALLAGVAIHQTEEAGRQAERIRVSDLAAVHTHALQSHIGQALSATYALAALVQQGRGQVEDFARTARQLLAAFPGAATLGLAPHGVVRSIYPLEGNAAVLGFDILHDPLRGPEAARARASRRLTLVGPFPLIQGGLGAIGQLPVFLDDGRAPPVFWGFVTSILRFPETLASARLPELASLGLGYELWRRHPVSGERQVIATTAPQGLKAPIEHTLEVPNGTWTLSVAPLAGWGPSPYLGSKIGLGLTFSLLLAYLAKLWLETQTQQALNASEARYRQEIERLAFYDPLTGLANRRLLLDRLAQAQVAAARSHQSGALLFMDLDEFKALNDTLGHDAGDTVLKEAARRMTDCVRGSDSVARLGGDEFVILLEGLSDRPELAAAQARGVGGKVLRALTLPYRVGGQDCHCTASIGITLFTHQDRDPEALLKRADLAMYQAKAAGRNGLEFFDSALQDALAQRATLASELREGLQTKQFVLHYQPQVDTAGHLIGAAALVHWQHPRRGLLGPAEFIPQAEESGLILPLGQWVLRTAAAQLAAWGQHPATAHLSLTLGIGVRQSRQPDFLAQVLAALSESGADPHRLRLDLTEQLLVEPGPEIVAKVAALKAQGVGLAVGDLGTGGSALARLRQLPLDQVKIHRSFVSDLPDDPNAAAITGAILTLARGFDLAVVAEGVETEAQRSFLAAHGCAVFQGNLFGPPGPAAALTASVGKAIY